MCQSLARGAHDVSHARSRRRSTLGRGRPPSGVPLSAEARPAELQTTGAVAIHSVPKLYNNALCSLRAPGWVTAQISLPVVHRQRASRAQG